jgi:intraflagellar transport protein 46
VAPPKPPAKKNRPTAPPPDDDDDNNGDFRIQPTKPGQRPTNPTTSGRPTLPKSPPGRSNFEDVDDSPPPRYDSGGDDSLVGASGMASLFALIGKFHPEPVDISVHWKPFIPDLIPAIGAIDAFIKVPRPDGDMDDLGLVILDEPSIAQSNPQVLRMELREQYGITAPGSEMDSYVGFIEQPQKSRKALDSWLESLEEIHRNRPPPSIIYSHKMPELEDLMELWPPQFEEALAAVLLPTADIDLSFDEYAKVICALLEIPVKANLIESLHHLFALYSSFAGNDYFNAVAAGE